MPQSQKRISIRSFPAIFLFVFLFLGSRLAPAQVPTSIPLQGVLLADASLRSIGTEHNAQSTVAENGVVAIRSAASSIPFGVDANPKTMKVLEMRGHDEEFVRSFTFNNRSRQSYTIKSIDFEKADNFFQLLSIAPAESLPFEVAPGEVFTVRIAFHAIDRGDIRTNTLCIHSDQSTEALKYPIQGLQEPLSAMPWNKQARNNLK
ncbi:MAG: hypothetical protein Q8919_08955 [Bacteroidota bacterium]|nr:hypothetical protein [Bacteroidota bacterium]